MSTPIDPSTTSTSAPTGLDRALLEWLGFDLDDVAEWWAGRESWPSPMRVLVDDLALRGVDTVDEMSEQDRHRLRVADRVSEVQEGYRRRFVTGMRRPGPGGRSVARHHDERRL
ncbi:hypothetical protein [Actinomycetospora cinnamomea]|uniref:Uncharacterized protein n=1 Tax=Actinomycetospora cinnamomea TaxID=663609 RepID=A0A2U1FA43_9PSEU|nr:hypothetical protein [Actinomycetospora cinnamomea]PVZ09063.1 hypothetical protein C8D89_107227 [Actinomycetospora cinnamomea]